MATKPTYLARYLAGEHEQVWAELQSLGEAVRTEPLYDDAMAVARETMRRVRYNIETLIARLKGLGYEFGYGWAEGTGFPSVVDPVFEPPAPDVGAKIAELEHKAGALPLSLRAFYEEVGAVNFVGQAPESWLDWRGVPDGLDALYVYPIAVAAEDAMSWEEHYGDMTEDDWGPLDRDEDDLCDSRAYHDLPHDCWLVPIAPDEWLKYDVGGCDAYEIAVPNLGADARLLTERHRTTFVSYLRLCTRWAGFSKLEQIPEAPNSVSALSNLTRDLLPF